VLFSDLVGSTAIASRLDPEEWRETVAGYHRAAAEAITQFDGHVAKYLGDGVMAYFGWPAAHDNDAERAVRAGLAILDAIAKLNEQPGVDDDIGLRPECPFYFARRQQVFVRLGEATCELCQTPIGRRFYIITRSPRPDKKSVEVFHLTKRRELSGVEAVTAERFYDYLTLALVGRGLNRHLIP
jgi:hypothetical protein